ncbi:MAG: hypothetical protein WDZ76_05890 [Pseudohongiellaceae bacterium]
MSEFEFISVFVSIVVAFAMAELLMGWGRLIRSRSLLEKPWYFIGWTTWLLFLMAFHYLGIWEYQLVRFHTVGQLVLLLSPPIVLVLLTFVLTPEIVPGKRLDLDAHYFDVKQWFFALAVVFMVLAFVADMLLPTFPETWISRGVLAALIIISISILMMTRSRPVHTAILVLNIAYLVFGSIYQDVRGL